MSTSRRSFLKSAMAAPVAWGVGSTVPTFLRDAFAGGDARANDKILVVVQLTGGNDGLNTVVPFADDAYRKARPKLALAADAVLKLTDDLALHPALRGFATLWEQSRLAIVQGVGYPNPNRSHFESMDIWHTCRRKTDNRTDGWLGRSLERLTSAQNDPLALHLGPEKQPLALASQTVRSPSVRSFGQFRLEAGAERKAIDEVVKADRPEGDDLLSFVQTSTAAALDLSERFGQLGSAAQRTRDYPQTDLGRKLASIAQLIAAGLSTRIYYVELDGFDTHSQQREAHASLLKQMGDAVEAFTDDMIQIEQGQRVLTLCFSEFGRRLAENASEGTDHGAAAPLFLAGSQVEPGLIGRHPSLTDLDEGDVKHHTDFRQVYAAVLDRWLGVPAEPILGETFEPIKAIRAG